MVPAMSHTALILALLLAQSGQSQTPPPGSTSAGNAVTRSLNSAPPSAVVGPGPAPRPTPAPSTAGATPPPTGVPVAAPSAQPPRAQPAVTQPPVVAPTTTPRPTAPVTAPAPSAAAPRPTTVAPAPGAVPAPAPVPAPRPNAPTASAPVSTPTPAPTRPVIAPAPAVPASAADAPVPAAEPVEPPPAPMTVLDATAIAALPFTVDLAGGLTVTTGRPGPNFNIWTIRRGRQPLVMVYAGPTSQFPIYSGDMVEAGGRASVVATEDGRRVALEHLFTRTTAPQEIHVWITSVEGADRTLAERIGQSIDAR